MKKTLIFLLTFLTLTILSNAQLTGQLRAGINDEKYLIGGIDVAYRSNGFEGAGVLLMGKYEVTYFGGRICYYIGDNFQVAPLIGYYFAYYSNQESEYSEENEWLWGYGGRVAKQISIYAAKPFIFIQAEHIEHFQFIFGVQFKLSPE